MCRHDFRQILFVMHFAVRFSAHRRRRRIGKPGLDYISTFEEEKQLEQDFANNKILKIGYDARKKDIEDWRKDLDRQYSSRSSVRYLQCKRHSDERWKSDRQSRYSCLLYTSRCV